MDAPLSSAPSSVLVVDDDEIVRYLIGTCLTDWGFAPVVVGSGEEAWSALQRPDAPDLAIVDWMMPGLSGVELCGLVRGTPATEGLYLMLLTGRLAKTDVIEGLEAGADDYLVKPVDLQELRARLLVGQRVVALRRALVARVTELEEAMARIRRLEGLVPICSYCKSVRTEDDYWQRVEQYVSERTDAVFSHGICPPCMVKLEEEWGDQLG